MPQYGLSLSKPAADFLRNLDRNDQERVRHILSLIQADPHIDGLVKHVYLMPPLVYTVYDHPGEVADTKEFRPACRRPIPYWLIGAAAAGAAVGICAAAGCFEEEHHKKKVQAASP